MHGCSTIQREIRKKKCETQHARGDFTFWSLDKRTSRGKCEIQYTIITDLNQCLRCWVFSCFRPPPSVTGWVGKWKCIFSENVSWSVTSICNRVFSRPKEDKQRANLSFAPAEAVNKFAAKTSQAIWIRIWTEAAARCDVSLQFHSYAMGTGGGRGREGRDGKKQVTLRALPVWPKDTRGIM